MMTTLQKNNNHLDDGLKEGATHNDVLQTKDFERKDSGVDSTLEQLGLERQTETYITMLEIISIGWNICDSYIGVIALYYLTLPAGGPVTLLYGILLIWVMYGCIVLTMAELASAYPTAGGQYHWSAILAPKSWARGISYTCGLISVYSWIALVAGVDIIFAQAIFAMVRFYHPAFVPKAWQYFLLYQAINAITILYNIFAMRRSIFLYNIAFALSLSCYFVIMVTCLARAPSYQPSSFVWRDFINYTGWTNDGVVFFIGLSGCNYMYGGIDGAIHLAEECKDAARAVPRALLSTWTDFASAVASGTGFPVYDIFAQATQSGAAATTFLLVLLCAGTMALLGCQQTASRLMWAFARDTAIPFPNKFGTMHKTLEAPVWVLVAQGIIIFVIGCIYLGSSTAFNALIGTGLILNLVSFAFPAAQLMFRGRSASVLPTTRYFKLPSIVGWIANFSTVGFAVVATIFYNFPVLMPVTSGNMNYAVVVLGIMAMFGVLNWFLWAKKHYKGPVVDSFSNKQEG